MESEDYAKFRDEDRRMECLRLAVATYGGSGSEKLIVAAAKEFESFVSPPLTPQDGE